MGAATDLRREIKDTFFPFMEAKGFSRDRSNNPLSTVFRRQTTSALHVCEVQWEKYGRPRFLFIFGTSTPPGTTYNGEKLPPEAIFPWNTADNGTLQPRKGASSRHWFRQDKPFLSCLISRTKLHSPQKTVAELIALFPEVEAYWQTRACGPHIHLLRHLP
jgi:hypothetical protein